MDAVPNLEEIMRILKGHSDYLRARIEDFDNIEKPSSISAPVHRTNKRTRDNDLCLWKDEGRKLLKEADDLLPQLVECSSFPRRAWKRKVTDQVVATLAAHDNKAYLLMKHPLPLPDDQAPHRGFHVPVQGIIGQAALQTLKKLQHLLQGARAGRVAIRGREGIGKTFTMKHLHNFVLEWPERFDYVFWVTSPDQFSIKHVQDAVAAAVKCDLSCDHDSIVRAEILSNKFASLGSFVIFLDGAPEADISLDDIGIPVPAEGSGCKLVLTTNSTLGCRLLDGFETVETGYLSENEAFELFLHEAKINTDSVTLLKYSRLLAEQCHGVPRKIVNLASRMCGIEDLHEWRNALFELQVCH